MSQNPNWPVMDEAACWAAGPQQTSMQPYWCSLIERTEAQLAIECGKQYELDQTQPGRMTTTWRNDDGAFDPDNETSPLAGYVTAYRLIRRRAQYPPSVNLLTQNQATAGQATAIPNAPQIEQPWGTGAIADTNSVYQNATYPTTIVADGSAYQGANVYQTAFPASGAYGVPVMGMQGFSVTPGGPATFTARARSKTASVTTTARLQIAWVNAAGTVISTVNGTAASLAAGSSAAWTTLTASATAPSNAAGAAVYLVPVSGPGTAWLLQTDGYQYEKALTASAFVVPGTWYPMFLGYIERWPQSWTSSGNYGSVTLTAMDIFANFAGRKMLAPFKADLMALNPNFLYALDEATGTTQLADTTGNRSAAVLTQGGQQNRKITAGNSVSAKDAGPAPGLNAGSLTGAFLGLPGPVVTGVNVTGTAPVTSSYIAPFINIGSTPAGVQGVPAVGTGWTRVFAARIGPAEPDTTTNNFLWALQSKDQANLIAVNIQWPYGSSSVGPQVLMQAQGGATVTVQFPGGLDFIYTTLDASGTFPVFDSDWHLYGVSLSADGKTVSAWCDNATAANTASTALPLSFASGVLGDDFGLGWQGDLSVFCELPMAMDAGTWGNLYQSWRNAWATAGTFTETSDSRYARILAWLGYVGPTRLSAGSSVKYGPATEVADQYGLPVLQTVVDSEAGSHFVAADGAVTFQSRADRYNKTAIVTFGENVAGGEYPYLSAQTDYDPTRVGNDAQVTATYGNALYRAQDPVSQNTFGDITLTRTVNSLDPNELTAAAQFLLLTNNVPLTRLEELPFDLSQNPALWPVLLALQLGVCVGWNRRPSNAPMLSLTGFVEKISWAIDDQNTATCKLQVSNAAKRNFGQWNVSRYSPDAGSMTAHAGGFTAGATTLIIDTQVGSPPASTAAGSYPVTVQFDNEQIVLNTAPSGSTSPQTFTGVTRGANGTTAAAHAAGAVLSLATPGRWAY